MRMLTRPLVRILLRPRLRLHACLRACAPAPARASGDQEEGGKKIRAKFISSPKQIFAGFEEARTRYVMVR